MISTPKSEFWRAEAALNNGVIPESIRGKPLVGVVDRPVFNRFRITLLQGDHLKKVEEDQELFVLKKYVNGKFDFVGYALRFRSTTDQDALRGYYMVYA